jgi:hypothetical protein
MRLSLYFVMVILSSKTTGSNRLKIHFVLRWLMPASNFQWLLTNSRFFPIKICFTLPLLAFLVFHWLNLLLYSFSSRTGFVAVCAFHSITGKHETFAVTK